MLNFLHVVVLHGFSFIVFLVIVVVIVVFVFIAIAVILGAIGISVGDVLVKLVLRDLLESFYLLL
jgi:hypothetical protein